MMAMGGGTQAQRLKPRRRGIWLSLETGRRDVVVSRV
jgi:hypothetical protein